MSYSGGAAAVSYEVHGVGDVTVVSEESHEGITETILRIAEPGTQSSDVLRVLDKIPANGGVNFTHSQARAVLGEEKANQFSDMLKDGVIGRKEALVMISDMGREASVSDPSVRLDIGRDDILLLAKMQAYVEEVFGQDAMDHSEQMQDLVRGLVYAEKAHPGQLDALNKVVENHQDSYQRFLCQSFNGCANDNPDLAAQSQDITGQSANASAPTEVRRQPKILTMEPGENIFA